MKDRITSEDIKTLKENEVFVYGDNLAHRHGKGAAKHAMKFGAKYGLGGFVGQTYGIPTKDKQVQNTLPINQIKPFVDTFIDFAITNPHLVFLVTPVGCGLAGLKPKDIAPLFERAVDVQNIHLPARFWHKLIKKEDEPLFTA
jgi:hypothetical protein